MKEDAAFQLGQRLEERTCLVVIDDVWDAADLQPFLRGGKQCARLFTMRDAEISSGAQRVNVDEMHETEAVELLTSGLPPLKKRHTSELSRRLGEWPLALELGRATMLQRIEQGDSPDHAAQRLLEVLDTKGVHRLKEEHGGAAEPNDRQRPPGKLRNVERR